jgi:hypothetical protein
MKMCLRAFPNACIALFHRLKNHKNPGWSATRQTDNMKLFFKNNWVSRAGLQSEICNPPDRQHEIIIQKQLGHSGRSAILIVPEILLPGKFQILQNAGFHLDEKIPAFVIANGDPVEAHFPAVQIAINIY